MSSRLVTICMVSMALGGCLALSQVLRGPGPFAMPPDSQVVPGAYARAAGQALNSFIHEFYKVDERSGDPLFECLKRPEVYDVQVGYDPGRDRYVVTVVTLDEKCLSGGSRIIHGAAYFEYEGKTFALVKRVWGEEEWEGKDSAGEVLDAGVEDAGTVP